MNITFQKYLLIAFSLIIIVCLGKTKALAQTPTASFTIDNASGCAILIVDFTSTSTGGPFSNMSWDFGNGNPVLSGNPAVNTDLLHPTITYPTAGTYTITLIVTNSSGTDTETQTGAVTVYGNPTAAFSANPQTGCTPFSPIFTNNSTPSVSGAITAWDWDFGNSQSSTAQNPSGVPTYTLPGTYTVSLSVTDVNGCTDDISMPNYITVSGPNASFTASPSSGCNPPLNVTFTNTTPTATGQTFSWDFGNGNTSTAAAPPQQTYTNAQNYTVNFTVTDNQGCVATATRTIILQPYVADFTTTTSSGCAPFQVLFTNAGNPVTANNQWNFGDPASGSNNQSFVASPTHTFNTEGTYSVRLIETYNGCPDTVFQTITVFPKPEPTAAAQQSIGCSLPFTATLQDNTQGTMTAWGWVIKDSTGATVGASSLETPSFTLTAEGVYSFFLSVTDANGCSDTATFSNSITVQLPIAHFNTDTPGGCFPLPVLFLDSSVFNPTANSWTWDFGDGTSGTGIQVSHVYSDTGQFDAILTVTNALGCTDKDTFQVLVGQTPTPLFSWTPDSTCFSNPISFTNLSSSFVDEWIWKFGDGGSQNIASPTYTFTDTGYFFVKLTVGHNLCYNDTMIDSAVYIIPAKAIIYQPTTNFCKEDFPITITPQDTSHSRGTTIYHWDYGFPNITTDTSNLKDPPPITYSLAGTYNLKLTVTDVSTGCPPHTDSVKINLDSLVMDPQLLASTGCQPFNATFLGAFSDPVVCPIQNYLWDFGDSTFPASTSDLTINHLYTGSGVFTATVTGVNQFGCSDTKTVDLTVRPRPVAHISSLDTLICLPGTGLFVDSSSVTPGQTITDYHWINEQNQQSSTNEFNVTSYLSSMADTIRHWVTDDAGCQSDTAEFYVRVSKVIASFTPSSSAPCSGVAVFFNNQQSTPQSGLSFHYDYGDGGIDNITNPSHIYNVDSTTIFTVLLTASDVYGCQDTAAHSILVSVPRAGFFVNPSDSLQDNCPPVTKYFTNTSSVDVTSITYIWGDGNSNTIIGTDIDSVASHVYTIPGTYSVTQVVVSGGVGATSCRDTLIMPAYIVVGGPNGTFTFNPMTANCAPLVVTFTAAGLTNVDNFKWIFGDGGTDTTEATVITHTFTSAGDYAPVLSLEDTSGCNVKPTGGVLSIHGPIVDFLGDSLELCGPYAVGFTNNTTVPADVTVSSWQWDFGDGGTSAEQNPGTHQYTAPGNYTVILAASTPATAEHPNGCIFSDTLENYISFFEGPNLNFTPISESNCPAICVDLEANIAGLPLVALEYTWDLIDTVISGETAVSWCYTKPGIYEPTFTVKFDNGCTYPYSTNAYINVWTVPEASFDAFPVLAGNKIKAMEFNSTSVGSDSVVWVFGDGSPNVTATSVSHTYNDTGMYNVLLLAYSDSGCADTAKFDLHVEESLNIPNVFSPNGDGFNDVFSFNLPVNAECLTLDVYDRWGNLKFHNDNFKNDWAGLDKQGKLLNPDTYYYVVNFCRRFTINGFLVIVYDNK